MNSRRKKLVKITALPKKNEAACPTSAPNSPNNWRGSDLAWVTEVYVWRKYQIVPICRPSGGAKAGHVAGRHQTRPSKAVTARHSDSSRKGARCACDACWRRRAAYENHRAQARPAVMPGQYSKMAAAPLSPGHACHGAGKSRRAAAPAYRFSLNFEAAHCAWFSLHRSRHRRPSPAQPPLRHCRSLLRCRPQTPGRDQQSPQNFSSLRPILCVKHGMAMRLAHGHCITPRTLTTRGIYLRTTAHSSSAILSVQT